VVPEMGSPFKWVVTRTPARMPRPLMNCKSRSPTVFYSQDILHALSVSAGSHLDRSTTPAYRNATGVWRTACFLTNDPGVLHPRSPSFTERHGQPTSRVYADEFRFIKTPRGRRPEHRLLRHKPGSGMAHQRDGLWAGPMHRSVFAELDAGEHHPHGNERSEPSAYLTASVGGQFFRLQ